MPSPFSWLQYHFGTQPGARLPAWTQILPGPVGMSARIINATSQARGRDSGPDWALNAATSGQPGFDPSTLEDAPSGQVPNLSDRPPGSGTIPGGIDIYGDSPSSNFPSFLQQFLQDVGGRQDYASANPPTTTIPLAPGQYPLPGGGDMSQAVPGWQENARRTFNPVTGGVGSFNPWLSEPKGTFGAQTVSSFDFGPSTFGGGGGWIGVPRLLL